VISAGSLAPALFSAHSRGANLFLPTHRTLQHSLYDADVTHRSFCLQQSSISAHFRRIEGLPPCLPVVARSLARRPPALRIRRQQLALLTMASQQVLFAETIAGMKKAFKRKTYESDSDSEIENHGNRGNKMKKRARFARKGQLVPTQGPCAYKEVVDFAGVRRPILHRNPPLVDDEGYEIDSDDDVDRIEEAELAAAELNPYAHIRLEHILAPLTASTDLPTHSTLSKPFVSKTLTDLVSQSCDMIRNENNSLWQVRRLWTALCGDGNWMPCELMVGPNDIDMFSDDHVARHLLNLAKASGADTSSPGTLNGDIRSEQVGGTNGTAARAAGDHKARSEEVKGDADVPMTDADPANNEDGKSKPSEEVGAEVGAKEHDGELSSKARQESKGGDTANKSTDTNQGTKEKPGIGQAEDGSGDVVMKDGEATTDSRPELETTGDRAPSGTPEDLEPAFIHPMFLTPTGAKADRDLGLPEHEAEDMRRLLALYVQKQEEVCRGTRRLHHGLLKAQRLRNDVLHWAKAEAHCGPNRDMSDGEDWYDKEEWGLLEDLKKGQDEEEEDTATAGKKTRNRR
ncbi:hypothetical protein TOPH_04819, partial [Tolypocladium ophioglossoides CBS 100239]